MNLTVNEIFYSLQGEGGRAGEASIFIRLTKCNLSCSFCDTDFADGNDLTLDQILQQISIYPCKWIVWTGGEPTIQLNEVCLKFFNEQGYKQAIETNGTRRIPQFIDYISCSPKQNYGAVANHVPFVHEVRIPMKAGDILPDIAVLPKADNYFLSPIFDADNINIQNVNYCVELIKQHPQWRLSLQVHKLINIE